MKKRIGKKIIVTGGAGFIGSALCRFLYKNTDASLLILDKMTYASNLKAISDLMKCSRVNFKKVNIGDEITIDHYLKKFKPDYIINLAAETHVDNSITNPEIFVETNVLDTHKFLMSVLKFYNSLSEELKNEFKVIHVSTDEVYGDIPSEVSPVDENYPYRPSSPYSASKAASDHLFKSYFKTYGLPTVITNCSNNYGPFQHSEKFIPVIIKNIIDRKKIPLYGNGLQKRDWLFVNDHCSALLTILKFGKNGESYNIGFGKEISNVDLIKTILKILEKKFLIPNNDFDFHIVNVTDRLGHDFRYSINSKKIRKNLNWKPTSSLQEGLKITIDHYLKKFNN